MRNLIVRDDHLESGFIALSKQLPVPVIQHTLQLPRQEGEGVIRGLSLEEGLFVRYAHFSYHDDLEIIRLPRQPDSETIISLGFLLLPETLKLTLPDQQSVLSLEANSLYLSSNNARFSVRLPKDTLTHSIMLLMTQEWLQENLAGMEERIHAIEQFLIDSPHSVITDKLRSADERLLKEIVACLDEPRINLLSLRARMLLLLSGTINRWPTADPHRPAMLKTWHVQTIRQVEERLLQSLEDMLPSQKQLAREFALSESTLKRHFKAVYGKTMYEYYLEKKMELAKRLLLEKKITVTETAYRLGYEKVSAFISMFKKIHKILPGSLK
ncbi:AraC family transcriptional regulator [Puia sp.]|jgi:AraC-like DNA-binding protein|uniref:helix-turn-helix transcriptional regulator n=1 Tax=Puia sp. TaxID=2045100 RepID=UPI002F4247BE